MQPTAAARHGAEAERGRDKVTPVPTLRRQGPHKVEYAKNDAGRVLDIVYFANLYHSKNWQT